MHRPFPRARRPRYYTFEESVMIGLGMLGRAELFFVVLDIGYSQSGILSQRAFFTLLFAAMCLNVAVPITITLWKPYLAGEKNFWKPRAGEEEGPGHHDQDHMDSILWLQRKHLVKQSMLQRRGHAICQDQNLKKHRHTKSLFGR